MGCGGSKGFLMKQGMKQMMKDDHGRRGSGGSHGSHGRGHGRRGSGGSGHGHGGGGKGNIKCFKKFLK